MSVSLYRGQHRMPEQLERLAMNPAIKVASELIGYLTDISSVGPQPVDNFGCYWCSFTVSADRTWQHLPDCDLLLADKLAVIWDEVPLDYNPIMETMVPRSRHDKQANVAAKVAQEIRRQVAEERAYMESLVALDDAWAS